MSSSEKNIKEVLNINNEGNNSNVIVVDNDQDNEDDNPQTRSASESAFVSLVFAIIISWILVALWTRVVENFVFGTLGLNGEATVDSLIVAVTITIIFFFLIWMLDQYGVIIGGLERLIEGETIVSG